MQRAGVQTRGRLERPGRGRPRNGDEPRRVRGERRTGECSLHRRLDARRHAAQRARHAGQRAQRTDDARVSRAVAGSTPRRRASATPATRASRSSTASHRRSLRRAAPDFAATSAARNCSPRSVLRHTGRPSGAAARRACARSRAARRVLDLVRRSRNCRTVAISSAVTALVSQTPRPAPRADDTGASTGLRSAPRRSRTTSVSATTSPMRWFFLVARMTIAAEQIRARQEVDRPDHVPDGARQERRPGARRRGRRAGRSGACPGVRPDWNTSKKMS